MYLALDFLFVKDIRDQSFEILTVMDMATLFHLAVRVARSGARTTHQTRALCTWDNGCCFRHQHSRPCASTRPNRSALARP